VDRICDRFEAAWKAASGGEPPRIDDYFPEAAGDDGKQLLQELILLDVAYLRMRGENPRAEEYHRRFPILSPAWLASALAPPDVPARQEGLDSTGPYVPSAQPDGTAGAGEQTSGGRLLGDYELFEELGKGGMGVVYRARQRSAGRIVALKLIRADRMADIPASGRDVWLGRFRTEAQAAARIDHEHAVTVYEVGEIGGQPFYSMRYVEGKSLADLLRDGPVPNRQAAAYLEPVARALHHVHGCGVLHRDIKPGNILVDAHDRAFLTDFGLARLVEASGQFTHTGEWLGTPSYMSPEQASDSTRVTAASDVYSLGATLYALLTGRPPFQAATTMETLDQVKHRDPVPPRQLNEAVHLDLNTICLKCLEKEPGKRYASAEALADDLGRFLAGRPIVARPVRIWGRLWKWARRRPAVASMSAAVVLVTVAALGLVTWQWRRAQGEAAQARAAEGAAEERRRQAEEVEARLALQQGQALCERGELGAGLLWLAHALKRAASAGTAELDRPIRINLAYWGEQVRPAGTRLANPGGVLGLAFGPGDRTLLAAGKDGCVHCWDLAAGREAGPALVHPSYSAEPWVSFVQFSPDSRTIATAGGQTALLWDAATHERNGAPLSHPSVTLWGMAFFPDGRLATCSEDGAARVWDLGTRRVVLGPFWHPRGAAGDWVPKGRGYYTLAISPDGKTLVTAGSDGRAIRWDLGTGKTIGPPLQHDSCVLKAVFTRDGSKLLTSTRGGTLHAWDLRTGRGTDLPPPGTETDGLALAPDGRWFATGTGFGVVRLWDTASLRPAGPVYRHPAGVSAVAFSRDGRRLAMGMADGGIHVVELPPSREATPPTHAGAEVCALQYTGDRLMAGTRNGVRWVETATGRLLDGRLMNPEEMDVECAALSPDGRSLAVGRWAGKGGFWRGRLEWWDPATGTRRDQTPDQPEPVRVVAYSSDGRRVFACGNRPDLEGGAALWEVATGRRLRLLLRSLGKVIVRQAAFDPAGRVLLLACSDGRARLWDAEADVEVDPRRPLTHAGAVMACAFDPEGRRVLTGSQDGTARLWDVETRRLLVEPLRHDAEVSAVAFSPDGRTLLTASLDGSARFWDAGSGKPLGPALGHAEGVRAVAFNRDGRHAATGGKDGAVRQWRVPPPPVVGPPERIGLWDEVLSGMELDPQGAVHELSAHDLAERRRRMELGGEPPIPPG
jgi:WD40 repeat protein/predicted Ser/Thr protein kinase